MKFAQVNLDRNVPCVMRDGVILNSDIYYPEGEEQLPILLMRQPYGKQLASTVVCAHPTWFANQGYIVIIQDVRGRGESEGEFYPFRSEAEDGYDTVEWAAALPRSNGKVGMYGFSYQGITQWAAASLNPPHLQAIAPTMAPVDCYDGMMYPYGSFALAELRTWAYQLARDGALRVGDETSAAYCTHKMSTAEQWLADLPIRDHDEVLERYFPTYYDWVIHSEYDEYWEQFNWFSSMNQVPALHIGGWYDYILNGTIEGYEQYSKQRSEGKQERIDYMIIGPWTHIPWGRYTGDIDHGVEAYGDIHRAQLQWFNYWLKNDNLASLPIAPIQYYEVNSKQWLTTDCISSMLIEEQDSYRLYVNNSGTPANGLLGGGTLTTALSDQPTIPDVFVYDARLPMTCSNFMPVDRSRIQQRNEVLVYSSQPFKELIKLLGAPKLQLKYETLYGPTDIVAILSVVHSDGRATMLSIGRAEVNSNANDQQGGITEVSIKLRYIGVELHTGMSLRLELTGSAFPLLIRHMNGVRLSEQLSLGYQQLNMATTAIYSNDHQCYLFIPLAK
ncbi:CocE/NonD family hydrolase [Paenibacillus endoradicis]|uniref:CocE/NonD family hydrolase n=1 Tax=Paenibacillus endoradicis TaxID=2972487 RepID=UPI0021598F06|nr:CocE/NonD family hydrolase [Paenibacillus endoradicis]MCR8657139.1 CocE/NonD family hydrolase [Paenibacillus endoradicis]